MANQLITGHCRLNHHLFRLGYALTPACDCGWPDENTFHFLFDCPRFSSLRGKLISACATSKVAWPPPLLALSQSSLIWNTFIRYLSKTKRLCSNASRGFRTIQEHTAMPNAGLGRLPSPMPLSPAGV